jgi:isoleucyl-tRNA synthetase
VFLAGMPKGKPAEVDESLEEEFRILRVIRESVNKAIEEKRAAKIVTKSTEVDAELWLTEEHRAGPEGVVLTSYAAQLADLFICASVTLKPVTAADGEAPLVVKVERSPHAACARCYRAVADVAESAAWGNQKLCARCVRAAGAP